VSVENSRAHELLNQKNQAIDDYIATYSDAIRGQQNADQSPIAQRNPTDFPNFLRAMKGGDITNAMNALKNILRTDQIIGSQNSRVSKEMSAATRSILRVLEELTTESEQSYAIAQFMDIMFADKNDISYTLENTN